MLRQTRTYVRLLALLLTLAMCLSLLPPTGSAASYNPADVSPQIMIRSAEISYLDGHVETPSFYSGTTSVTLPANATRIKLVLECQTPDIYFRNSSPWPILSSNYSGLRLDSSYQQTGSTVVLDFSINRYASVSGEWISGYFPGSEFYSSYDTNQSSTRDSSNFSINVEASSSYRVCEVWFNPNGGTALRPSSGTFYDKDWEGATLQTMTDSYGRLSVLPNAIRDGYTFDGWYTSPDGGTKVFVDQDLSPYQGNGIGSWTSNQIVLWAHWTTQSRPSVYFFPNGGVISNICGHTPSEYINNTNQYNQLWNSGLGYDLSTKAAVLRTSSNYTIQGFPTATRDGYVFEGWYPVSRSEIPNEAWRQVNVSPEFISESGFSGRQQATYSSATTYSSDAYYVAKWRRINDNYTVTFNLNGAPGTPPAAQKVAPNGTVSLPKETPVWQGHSFLGWFSGTKNGSQLTNSTRWYDGHKVTSDVTLYAVWSEVTSYTVKFDLNGAPGTAPATQTVDKGRTVPLPSLPTWSGHRCLGWGYTSNGKAPSDWQDTKSLKEWKSTDTPSKDMTLYARWDVDRFSFANSSTAFNSTYAVTGNYLTALQQLPASQWTDVASLMNSKWGGACYGLSALFCLSNTGAIDPGYFQTNASYLYDLATPKSSDTTNNLVNYYFLQQATPYAHTWFDPDKVVSGEYAMDLVKTLQQTTNPVLISFLHSVESYDANALRARRSNISGHTVVGLKVRTVIGGYEVDVWDSNQTSNDTLIIKENGTNVTLQSKKYMNIRISGVQSADESKQSFDALNIQSYLSGKVTKPSTGLDTNVNKFSTTLTSYTLTASDGSYIQVKDGKVTESTMDLDVQAVYAGSKALTALVLPNSQTYTLSANGSGDVHLSTSQYSVDLASKNLKSLSVTSTGIVSLEAEKAAQQTLTVTSDQLGSVWNSVTMAGSDTGMNVKIGKETVSVTSRSNGNITITGSNVFSSRESIPQTVAVSPAGAVISTANMTVSANQTAPFPFTDVPEKSWYRPFVEAAYYAKLINGATADTYAPENTLTLAESVTLAARIYAENHGETVSSGSTPWYKAAYDYCVQKGVIDGNAFDLTDLPRTANRYEMVTILTGAIPSERLDNSVPIPSIPDLKESDPYGAVVYRWYRAGLVSGDANGNFNGSMGIKRSEVAKILCTINRLM